MGEGDGRQGERQVRCLPSFVSRLFRYNAEKGGMLMAILSVSYDLREHGRHDYRHLEAAIKSFRVYCHALQSTWFIETNAGPKEVYDYLKPNLGSTDSLLVVPVVVYAYWGQGLPQHVHDWLTAAYKAQQAA
jgi:hypothetical protein